MLRGTQRDGKQGRSISDTDKGTIARINREQLIKCRQNAASFDAEKNSF
ncbi:MULTISPECIES: hypothetical protein [Paraburkholderia]|uniref:Uncharacterized protein n=1 Tax=Paraburkholderia dipogonis TaxID=1211383 RepID=A0ABW9AU66_9BURK